MTRTPTQPANALATRDKAAAKDFPALLDSKKDQIAMVLPPGLDIDRVVRLALNAYHTDLKIKACTPLSILTSVMKAAELGLEPSGGFKHCYLVPRGGQCTFQISYTGMLELARRSGFLKLADARLVHEQDEFDLYYDPRPVFRHRPLWSRQKGDVILAYAFAILSNGETSFEVMTWAEIEDVRIKTGGPVWQSHWGEMARKTVLKRMLKKLPLSVEVADVIAHEESGPLESTVMGVREEPGTSRSAGLASTLSRRRSLAARTEPDDEAEYAPDPVEQEPSQAREPGEEG